jgi:hypothetical protein
MSHYFEAQKKKNESSVSQDIMMIVICIIIFSGKDESQYWNKMHNDREQKISNNIRVKQRGRDKILKTAERELGKHIRFDE